MDIYPDCINKKCDCYDKECECNCSGYSGLNDMFFGEQFMNCPIRIEEKIINKD